VFVLELRAPAECAETERETLYRQALDTLRTLPDVAEVGAIDSLPLFGSGGRLLSITGRTVEERGLVYMATSGFFRALAIPVVAGSGFSDRPDDAGTALLSHSAQSRFFRGKAVGELFEGAAGVSSVRIRGIVGDTKRSFRMAPVPAMFLPMKFGACSVVNYVVRMREGAAAPVELLRRKVAAATSGGALSVERLDAQVYSEMREIRFLFLLVGGLAAIAIIVALAGIGGVVDDYVESRAKEFAIRWALGATSLNLVLLVLRRAVLAILIGVVAGVAGGVAFAGSSARLLYGVSPAEPWIYAVSAGGGFGAAMAAALLGARRAASVARGWAVLKSE
jgi:hypothetical protein